MRHAEQWHPAARFIDVLVRRLFPSCSRSPPAWALVQWDEGRGAGRADTCYSEHPRVRGKLRARGKLGKATFALPCLSGQQAGPSSWAWGQARETHTEWTFRALGAVYQEGRKGPSENPGAREQLSERMGLDEFQAPQEWRTSPGDGRTTERSCTGPRSVQQRDENPNT